MRLAKSTSSSITQIGSKMTIDIDDPHDDVVHWIQFIRESEKEAKDDS